MLKSATATVVLSLLATSPTFAQQHPDTVVPTSDIDPRVIGLPIHSSDKQVIGIVKQAGVGNGEPVLIGEVERPLGLGPDLLAIPISMYVNRGDHIELTIRADQVREKLEHNRSK
jgi:hypothetical protein